MWERLTIVLHYLVFFSHTVRDLLAEYRLPNDKLYLPALLTTR